MPRRSSSPSPWSNVVQISERESIAVPRSLGAQSAQAWAKTGLVPWKFLTTPDRSFRPRMRYRPSQSQLFLIPRGRSTPSQRATKLMMDEALYGGTARTYLSRCRIAVFPPASRSLTRIAEAAFVVLRCRHVLRQALSTSPSLYLKTCVVSSSNDCPDT